MTRNLQNQGEVIFDFPKVEKVENMHLNNGPKQLL